MTVQDSVQPQEAIELFNHDCVIVQNYDHDHFVACNGDLL